MLPSFYAFLESLKYTPLHPQWITNHFHQKKYRLLETTTKPGVCLDIGAGSNPIKDFVPDGRQIVTLDYPCTAANYKIAPNIYGDVQQLPFAKQSIDNVILFEVLEHVADDSRALACIAEVLRDDGFLFVSVPFIYPIHDRPFDFRRYTVYGVEEILRQHGFDPTDTSAHGNSIVAVLQLVNLSILELVRMLYAKSKIVATLAALVVAPLCLTLNLIALPFINISKPDAMVLGYTVVATRTKAESTV